MEALYSGCQVISTQQLSFAELKNLYTNTSKTELVKSVITLLNQNRASERITFNTMENSAQRMMQLLLR